MAWIAVVTNAGRALLDSYAAGGHTLTLTDVTVGAGMVPDANLRIQTAVSSEKSSGSIISAEAVTGGTKFKLQVGPATGSVDAYVCHQIGLWAKLDNGNRTLMLLAQDATGVSVPHVNASPSFAFALYVALAVDNTSTLSVNIDQSAYVTQDTLDEALAPFTKSRVYIASEDEEIESDDDSYEGLGEWHSSAWTVSAAGHTRTLTPPTGKKGYAFYDERIDAKRCVVNYWFEEGEE